MDSIPGEGNGYQLLELVFLPGKFHGPRSLVGYSPWGHKESDMAKQLTYTKGQVEISARSKKKNVQCQKEDHMSPYLRNFFSDFKGVQHRLTHPRATGAGNTDR